MRLRIVLASGEVAHDPQGSTVGGLVGHDLNQACRLLDADVLREALRQRETADCVLCVSAPVYEGWSGTAIGAWPRRSSIASPWR